MGIRYTYRPNNNKYSNKMVKKAFLGLWVISITMIIIVSIFSHTFIKTKLGQHIVCDIFNQGLTFNLKELHSDTLCLKGYINHHSVKDFEQTIQRHPNVKVLQLDTIPGSLAPQQGILLGKAVRQLGLSTYIPKHGVIIGCGIDIFLGGEKRMAEESCTIIITTKSNQQSLIIGDAEKFYSERHNYYYLNMGIDNSFIEYINDLRSGSRTILSPQLIKELILK